MEFIERDSGLVVPAEKPEPPTEPTEPPRGEYGEPWEVGEEATTDGSRSVAWIVVNGKQAIRCESAAPLHDKLRGHVLADRIVACVNACEGIDDEALSGLAMIKIIEDQPAVSDGGIRAWLMSGKVVPLDIQAAPPV